MTVRPDVVVFDIDDTLYLERDYVRSGFVSCGSWLAAEHVVDGFGARAWDLFEAGVRGDTFDRALADLGVDGDLAAELIPDLIRHYRHHTPDIGLLDDARRCIDAAGAFAAVAVITDGPEASQAAKAAALGADDWSQCTVLTARLGAGMGKPHPAAFRQVEATLGASAERCVYLADNPTKDFAGPAGLGWQRVRIRRPGQLHADVPSGDDVDVEVGSLDDVTAAWAAV